MSRSLLQAGALQPTRSAAECIADHPVCGTPGAQRYAQRSRVAGTPESTRPYSKPGPESWVPVRLYVGDPLGGVAPRVSKEVVALCVASSLSVALRLTLHQ